MKIIDSSTGNLHTVQATLQVCDSTYYDVCDVTNRRNVLHMRLPTKAPQSGHAFQVQLSAGLFHIFLWNWSLLNDYELLLLSLAGSVQPLKKYQSIYEVWEDSIVTLIMLTTHWSNCRNIFTTAPDIDSKDIDRCLIVRQISKIYDGLCDIVETINFCFSFQV